MQDGRFRLCLCVPLGGGSAQGTLLLRRPCRAEAYVTGCSPMAGTGAGSCPPPCPCRVEGSKALCPGGEEGQRALRAHWQASWEGRPLPGTAGAMGNATKAPFPAWRAVLTSMKAGRREALRRVFSKNLSVP